MGYQELALSLLAVFPLLVVANVGPPVLMFKDARVDFTISKPLAGHTVSTADFTSTLSGLQSDVMITFVQDELSNEDFLRLDKDMKRGGLFKNVQKYSTMKTSTYFPSVKAPLHSLSNLMEGYDEQVELKDADEAVEYFTETKLQNDTSIVIHLLPTVGEDSSAAIKKNDEVIGQVMSMVEQSGLTYIAFFSSKTHRKTENVVVQGVGRHLLAVDDSTASNDTFYNSTECLLYFKNMKVNGKLVDSKPAINCTVDNGTTTVSIGENVEMTFVKDAFGMWVISSTTVDNKPAGKLPDVSAPLTFSYHCSQLLEFTNENETLLSFEVLQIQVFDITDEGKFGYAYDCTGFFTIPLWTGLLTAFFLLFVTIYGLYMLSSIQTFDQFDDPKSKPLTINISE